MTTYYSYAPNPRGNPDLMESDSRCGVYRRLFCVEMAVVPWTVCDRLVVRSVWKDANNMRPDYIVRDMERVGLPLAAADQDFWAFWHTGGSNSKDYDMVGEQRIVTSVVGICSFWSSVWPQWHRGANLDRRKLTREQQARADDLAERWYGARHFGTVRRPDGSIGEWWER